MKHKLINKQTSEETLCDKVTIDGYDYYVSDETIEEGWRGTAYKKDVKGQIFKHFYTTNKWYKNAKKVIATTNPNIDDIPKVVDEVERLANEFGYHDQTSDTLFREGLILGYNKSQETHPFTEEDMIEFADWVYRSQFDVEGYTQDKETKELLQLWKEQKPKTLYYE